jgi:hypothetical protein
MSITMTIATAVALSCGIFLIVRGLAGWIAELTAKELSKKN